MRVCSINGRGRNHIDIFMRLHAMMSSSGFAIACYMAFRVLRSFVVFKNCKDVDVFSSLHSLSRLTVLTITVCDGRRRGKDPDTADVSDFWRVQTKGLLRE